MNDKNDDDDDDDKDGEDEDDNNKHGDNTDDGDCDNILVIIKRIVAQNDEEIIITAHGSSHCTYCNTRHIVSCSLGRTC